MKHLESSQLLDVAAALDWDVDAGLRHLAACDDCRRELGQAAEMRRALAVETVPRDGFVDNVLSDLPPDPAPVGPGIRVVNALLAGLVSVFTVALAGGTHPSIAPGPGMLGLVLVAAISGYLWSGFNPSSGAGTFRAAPARAGGHGHGG